MFCKLVCSVIVDVLVNWGSLVPRILWHVNESPLKITNVLLVLFSSRLCWEYYIQGGQKYSYHTITINMCPCIIISTTQNLRYISGNPALIEFIAISCVEKVKLFHPAALTVFKYTKYVLNVKTIVNKYLSS